MSTEVTPAQVYEAANRHLGRPILALDELLRLLHANLPPVLADRGLPEIRGYYYAGENISGPWPALVLSASFDTQPMGSGHLDRNHVLVTYATQPVASRRQVQEAGDTIALIRALLYLPVFRHRRDAQDRLVWNALLPTGLSLVPWNERYGGWILHLELLQAPGANLWGETSE